MRLNDINGKTTFGWTSRTHAILTEKAIEKIPQLTAFSSILQKSSKLPDFSLKCTGLFNNSHRYFGQKLFMPVEAPQNAFEFYHVFLSDAIKFMADGNDVAGMQKAGMALHFLQDVANPFHTDRNATGILNFFPHRRYEKMAENMPGIITEASKGSVKTEQNFYDIFRRTYFDKRPEELAVAGAGKNSKTNMQTSIKHTLVSAYGATEKFLKRIAMVDSLPDSKKLKFLSLDIDEFLHG